MDNYWPIMTIKLLQGSSTKHCFVIVFEPPRLVNCCITQRYHVTLKHLQVAGLLLNGYHIKCLSFQPLCFTKHSFVIVAKPSRLVYCCTLKHPQALGHLLDARQDFRPLLSAVRARQAISAWHSLSSALLQTALSCYLRQPGRKTVS